MRAREVFLALLIIGAGVFLTYEKSGRLDRFWEAWDGPWLGSFDEFIYEETQEISGPPPAELQVVNSHGEVVVIGTETDKVTVVFKERISAHDKAEADRIAADLRMIVTASGSRLVLSTNRDGFLRPRFSTDFKIAVPAGTVVLLKNSYGLVRTERTGRTEIADPHGEVVVRGVEGSLILANSYENVDVDGVRGDVRIEAPHSEVAVKNIQGELTLDHSYGEITLENISRKLIVNGNRSKIAVKGLRDEAEISSSYETITISEAAAVRIRARHCEVEANGLTGLLDVTNDYGLVKVGDLKGDLKIDGRNVEIDGRNLFSPEIFVRTSYRNVFLGGFGGKTTVVISHGELNLEPIQPLDGAIDVQGTYAGVQVVWPAGLRAPFEGRSYEGGIVWNLPERPDVETTNGSAETKAFGGEVGKPGVKIVTTHGDIRIEPSARR